MKLILIDGGPASGKNTLGKLLVDQFNKNGEKAILLDLDSYVEEFNPKWIWESKEQEEKDHLNARVNFVKDINKYLQEDLTVVAIGERFLTHSDVSRYTEKLGINYPIYLFHLTVPRALRQQRLDQRGPHSLINLDKDQKDRDAIKDWPGYVYENINSPEEDAKNLYDLIRSNKGLINL
ncbi:MAG: hypothetical protein ACD_38C00091G0005 [uncultured bacterium]|uniref:UDP-N-acetylglucosamine kinase n=1 Tax=Candidatus Daviesbacteria bacterium GW2011_GWC2_40_12 TaxID=1618431 RepID=A0A0G0QPQ8_9BACT|nr:MAG: hypothetical protein ACD_38C00091G0005 [uncultured bacterium]KKQ82967.1 MAG: hypothetical protein UT04_C0042G0011 [Candidatus Daviesbacteria bacterium GW2011_GWF2_38_7]KKR16789.1 MAG: hypothetical protein UT45_C0004G0120 [Candidatus Daviesbacteria bacterium GW2011_GWA2_39_33]KKR24505.1 MAG: hypothetical protein UT54_C0018G0005 [Candidatus Daviesbacteria bacterium GW2011_GWB1_39_5]KKR42429.1 MAG: hypothetical protein UT77_C0002G0082 [Candidatus Daviesbacteria bacterium GW2011_GWC2_40_12]